MVKAEFIRYIGVGLSNTLLTLALYWALLFVASHRVAYLAAFLAGVAYTAFANSRFTFRVSSGPRALTAYALFCVALFVFNSMLLEWLVSHLMVDKRIAIFGVIAAGIPIGFAGSRFILKR